MRFRQAPPPSGRPDRSRTLRRRRTIRATSSTPSWRGPAHHQENPVNVCDLSSFFLLPGAARDKNARTTNEPKVSSHENELAQVDIHLIHDCVIAASSRFGPC